MSPLQETEYDVNADATAQAAAEEFALQLLTKYGERLLNAVDDGIYCLDDQGRTIFINEAASRMLGYTPREIIGKLQHDLIHYKYADGSPFPVDACPIYGSVREGIQHRVGSDVFWRKDGKPILVDYTSIPIKEGRRTLAVVVTFRDVTEQRRAEEASAKYDAERAARAAAEEARASLEKAERRLRLALEAGKMGTWEWDIPGEKVAWSAEIERMFGLEPGTFSGTLDEYGRRIHAEDRDRVFAELQAAMANQSETFHTSHRILRDDDNQEAWLDCHARFIYDGEKPVRLVGVSLDISERRRSEMERDAAYRAAERARDELFSAFEQAPAAICVMEGPDNVIRWANELYHKVASGRELLGRKVREAWWEPQYAPLLQLIDEVYATGKPFIGNSVPVPLEENGQPKVVNFNFVIQPLLTNGKVTGTLVHAVELSEQPVPGQADEPARASKTAKTGKASRGKAG